MLEPAVRQVNQQLGNTTIFLELRIQEKIGVTMFHERENLFDNFSTKVCKTGKKTW